MSNAIKEVISQANKEASRSGYYAMTQQDIKGTVKHGLPSNYNSRDYLSVGVYLFPCNDIPNTCKQPRFYRPLSQYSSDTPCNKKTGLPWVSCDNSGVKNMDVYRADLGETVMRKMWAAVTLSLIHI